jgi:arabinofuranosyltransferase
MSGGRADCYRSAMAIPSRRSRVGISFDSRRLVASWALVAVPTIIALAGAWSYRWVQEDAFIDFRIIGNLLAGHGPVFNVGERVEAYSDPLWMYLLAGIHWIIPFLSLEWLSVVLGLLFTGVGCALAGRAIQRLGASRGDLLVFPVGLLILSVVAGVWEFSTGGLEMGMVIGWIGLSFWLLVRTESRRTSATWCAFVVGLGTLIRPELLLMSVVFLVGLGAVVAAAGWKGTHSFGGRFVLPLLASAALPFLYELWRMAYFALDVSNTALAKSAGAAWWSQGLYYLWNFVGPYALWVPMILVAPLMVPRIVRWWASGDRCGVVVLLTPVIAGLADTLYVVHVGGDYMHARLLIPAFMALCTPIYVGVTRLRSLATVAVGAIVIWAVVCGGWLRFNAGATFASDHGISNERSFWIAANRNPHPITVADWQPSAIAGEGYRQAAAAEADRGGQVMLVFAGVTQPWVPSDLRPATSPLPFHLAVNLTNIGIQGLVSGPQVYIFDSSALANPIGSHTTLAARGRPGAKFVQPAWMIARFSPPGSKFPASTASARSVAAAKQALSCQPLSSYLRAITAPLTVSQAVSNIFHSFTYTRMTFSPDPIAAKRQLCQ